MMNPEQKLATPFHGDSLNVLEYVKSRPLRMRNAPDFEDSNKELRERVIALGKVSLDPFQGREQAQQIAEMMGLSSDFV